LHDFAFGYTSVKLKAGESRSQGAFLNCRFFLTSGKLKAGEDVTLEDGRVVRSADVVADAAAPSSYIVIEIPDR
jgi:hypothetical protein